MREIDIYFEVKSFLDKNIRTTLSHWELISKLKHPEIEGKEVEVKQCLSNPIEIRKSFEDPDVYLYYRSYMTYYICVVTRHLNGDGFIITAYLTDKIKEGASVWKR